MPKLALLIFALAAAGGLYMATRVLKSQLAPWAVSLLHAALGATGILLLLWALVTQVTGALLCWSLALFVVAALGGFLLASFHVRKKLPPKAIVFIHGGVAVIAFLLLAVAVFAPAA